MLGYEQDKMKTLSSRRCNDEKQYYLSLFFGDDSNDFDEYKRPDDLYKNISHDKGGDAFQNKIVKDIPSCRSKSNVNGEYRTTHGLHSIKCGCNISSNDICKKKNALDLVDMSIQSSKNIVKNSFKRHVSGNMDFVYQFSIIDALIGIGSIIVYFLDIVTDVKVAVHYFLECHYFYGSVTAGLIIVPSLVTCCFGIHWYLIDYRMEHKVVARRIKSGQRVLIRTPTNVWFCRFFFTALQLGPVVRTVEYLQYGFKSRSSKKYSALERKRFHWWMLYEDVDNCLLRLFESFLESAPQLSWQLYIYIKLKPKADFIGTTTRTVSLLSSWMSLAVSLVSYNRSLRNSRVDKCKMGFASVPFYFIWRASETGVRVLCLAMFASALDMWLFAILVSHWIIISGWIMSQHTTFYTERCLERLFNVVCGYVMIFCFLNLNEGHTRCRFLVYYAIFYVENVFMVCLWFYLTDDLGTWFHLWAFISVFILFFTHLLFQLLYYLCCHPTKEIKCCLPCDNYASCVPVCYDVQSDVDICDKGQNTHLSRKVSDEEPDGDLQYVGGDGGKADAVADLSSSVVI